MNSTSEREFTGIRSYVWPIHPHEVKKVVPMILMLVCICLNYSILRNLKDVVVITAKESGAEVLPFIKLWAMFPMALISVFVFTKLTNRFAQDTVFYLVISFFLSFYTLFVFVLHPMQDILHPHATCDFLQSILPQGCKGLIAMVRNWSFTLFYVMCELWGSMVLLVLFWGFANEVTKIHEARRFYSVLAIGSNFAAAIAGKMANFLTVTSYSPYIPYGSNAWEQTMFQTTVLLILSGMLIMGSLYWLNKNVLSSPEYDDFHNHIGCNKILEKKKKKKLSLKESIQFLSTSKYLLCIATLVIAYNLVINMVEVLWKDQLNLLYPNPVDYSIYINDLTFYMGSVATLAALFLAKAIEKLGWSKTALGTPMIMLITSVGFFFFYFLKDSFTDSSLLWIGMTPLAMTVFFGSAQNCLTKAAKYSLFDTTYQMAYIPLDHETKLKGKAAIDGVGSRVAKSGGSAIHQSLLLIFSSFSAAAPYIAAIVLIAITLWILATRSLGKQFAQLVSEQDPQAAQELETSQTTKGAAMEQKRYAST